MRTDARPTAGPEPAPANAPLPLKAVVAVVIGNWLEFYDFLAYTFFAVMIAAHSFPANLRSGDS